MSHRIGSHRSNWIRLIQARQCLVRASESGDVIIYPPRLRRGTLKIKIWKKQFPCKSSVLPSLAFYQPWEIMTDSDTIMLMCRRRIDLLLPREPHYRLPL